MATFRESTRSAIGMWTDQVGGRPGRFRQARSLRPQEESHTAGATRAGHPSLQLGEPDGGRPAGGRRVGRQRGHEEAGGPHPVQPCRPRDQPGERDVEDMPDRNPDRPAVEGIGGGRIEEDAAHPEGGGVAEQGPDVLVVVEALEDGDE